VSDLFKKLVENTTFGELDTRESQERLAERNRKEQAELSQFPKMIQERNKIERIRANQERRKAEREHKSMKGKLIRTWKYIWDLD
jgi:hypothetical protein